VNRRHALYALAAVGANLAIWPGIALTQTTAQHTLVAYLSSGPASGSKTVEKTLTEEFARLGWKEGENLQFEVRYGNHQSERIVSLAHELVAMNPALLLGNTTEVTLALKKATDRVPIVMLYSTNPVGLGLAASLARPGGNVTGLVTMGGAFFPKVLEYARAVAPHALRIGYLFNPANPNMAGARKLLQPFASRLGLEIVGYPVRNAQEIEKAVRAMTPARDYVLIPQQDILIGQHLDLIAALALAAKLPSVSAMLDWTRRGGLLAYGPDYRENMKRAAQIADQILRGAKAGEIPIEQPTRVHLILNQRTARAIGVQFPNDLLIRADRVIE